MNPQDIPIAGPVYLFFWNAIEWLNPAVQVAGLTVAIWAFQRCRKWGYFTVGCYFALTLFSICAMPYINRALNPPIHFSQSQQQRINEAINKIIQEDEGQPQPIEKHIRFPLGPIVLVIGLWLLARREQRKQIKPPTRIPGLSQDEGRIA